jgi:polysaccharide transporter, PST family
MRSTRSWNKSFVTTAEMRNTYLPLKITAAIRKILSARFEHLKVTSLYLGERIYAIGLSFITYSIFARSYGPTLLGSYSYALTVMQFAVPFLAVGSEGVVIREIVRRSRPMGEVMGSACLVLSGVGLAVTLIPLAFIAITQRHDTTLLTVASLIALSFIPSGILVAEQALKAELRAIPVVAVRMATATASASAKLFVALHQYPIEFFAAITAAEAFVLSGLLLYAYRREGYSIRAWRLNFDYAKFLLSQSAPIMLSSVVVMLFFRANHVLLFYASGAETVGQYALAFQAMQLFLVFPEVFFRAAYPRLVSLHTKDPARFISIINACYFWFSCLGYAIVIFNFLFAPSLFGFFFGPRFGLASKLIVILSVANLFDYFGAIRAQFININNATNYHLVNAGVGFVVLLLFDALFVPAHGAIGASWSLAIAFFVSSILTSFIFVGMRSTGWVQLKALIFIPSFGHRLGRRAPLG